jgi:hypothetical protein
MDAEKPAPVAREVEELPVEEEAGR